MLDEYRDRWHPLIHSVCLMGTFLVSACAVVNPAPFNPLETDAGKTLTLSTGTPDAGGFRAMAETLLIMSNGYVKERNELMQEEVVLDLALIGLTAAAVINPIFHGANAATVGLGLGAGTLGATRLYFAPQTRVSLYNSASAALGCASGVSGEMADWYNTNYVSLVSRQTSLNADLAAASVLLTNGSTKGDAATKLLAARDTANAALGKSRLAVAALDGGAGRLRSFAIQTVNTTSKSVVTGTQNLDAALAKINSLAPAAPKTAGVAPAAAPAPTPKAAIKTPDQMNAAELSQRLSDDAAAAEALANPVNDTWARLATCAPSAGA
jgi:hypothetical protein